jgi:hypothetical protein
LNGTSAANGVRDIEAEFDQALALPSLRTWLVDLEDSEAGRDLLPPLGEAIEADAENDILTSVRGQPLPRPGPR